MDGEAKKRKYEGDGAGLQGRSVEAGRETPERRPGRTSTGESTVLRLLPCSNEDGIPLLYSPPAGPRLFARTADGRDNKPRPRPHDDGQYAESSFAGPEQVLAYLSRYTHRIAISNRRLVALNDSHVAFTWRDYARGRAQKIMRLDAHEFLRRFLLHVFPDGFQRIRHYGFLANGHRRAKLISRHPQLARCFTTVDRQGSRRHVDHRGAGQAQCTVPLLRRHYDDHRSPAGPAPPPMAEARYVMRAGARTTRPEAVTAPHRRPAPKAAPWRPLWASSRSCRYSKAWRDARIVQLFIATAMPNTPKPRRYCHQSP